MVRTKRVFPRLLIAPFSSITDDKFFGDSTESRMRLETEKCPVCGTSVKKENLKGHLARVHLGRPTSPTNVPSIVKNRSVFSSHRKRNVAILSLVVLAVVGIALFGLSAQDMHMPGTNPGPASAGSIEQFSYLSQQDSRCLWGASMGDEMGYTNWINGLADDTYIQGACCNPMVTTDYQSQISGLHDRLYFNHRPDALRMHSPQVCLQILLLDRSPADGTLLRLQGQLGRLLAD